jgi:hypothetical protein
MTQSLINQGREGNHPNDNFNALPKWICAEDFKARPENKTGLPRMELARTKCDEEQFLAIFNPDTGLFTDRCTCEEYTPGSLEIRIVEIR